MIVNRNEMSRHAAKIMYGPHKEQFDYPITSMADKTNRF